MYWSERTRNEQKLGILAYYAGSSRFLTEFWPQPCEVWKDRPCVCQTCEWRETLPRAAKGNENTKGHLVHLETTWGSLGGKKKKRLVMRMDRYGPDRAWRPGSWPPTLLCRHDWCLSESTWFLFVPLRGSRLFFSPLRDSFSRPSLGASF